MQLWLLLRGPRWVGLGCKFAAALTAGYEAYSSSNAKFSCCGCNEQIKPPMLTEARGEVTEMNDFSIAMLLIIAMSLDTSIFCGLFLRGGGKLLPYEINIGSS